MAAIPTMLSTLFAMQYLYDLICTLSSRRNVTLAWLRVTTGAALVVVHFASVSVLIIADSSASNPTEVTFMLLFGLLLSSITSFSTIYLTHGELVREFEPSLTRFLIPLISWYYDAMVLYSTFEKMQWELTGDLFHAATALKFTLMLTELAASQSPPAVQHSLGSESNVYQPAQNGYSMAFFRGLCFFFRLSRGKICSVEELPDLDPKLQVEYVFNRFERHWLNGAHHFSGRESCLANLL